jgi:hypothetical protein
LSQLILFLPDEVADYVARHLTPFPLLVLLPSPSQQDRQQLLQTPALKSYSNQKVRCTGHVKDTDNPEVDTKIAVPTSLKKCLSINYKLQLVNEEWKATDVAL